MGKVITLGEICLALNATNLSESEKTQANNALKKITEETNVLAGLLAAKTGTQQHTLNEENPLENSEETGPTSHFYPEKAGDEIPDVLKPYDPQIYDEETGWESFERRNPTSILV